MTDHSVIVTDDGSGMREQEVRNEYLKIARDRRKTKGDRTPRKHRPVKGRKRLGKFAGLIMAGEMRVETKARGRVTTLLIRKQDLNTAEELEALPLAIEVGSCEPDKQGTEIWLSALEQNWNFPSADRLRAAGQRGTRTAPPAL